MPLRPFPFRLAMPMLLLGALTAGCTSPDRQTAPAPEAPFAADVADPVFDGTAQAIDAAALASMGTSWRPGCPVARHDLRVLRMPHWGFDGTVQRGEMIVHESQAHNVLAAFAAIFDARFPIATMVIANGYIGDDPARAQQNATSAFNCRKAVGSAALSQHAYGLAVDINPVQNPRISTTGGIIPPGGEAYTDRTLDRPGMIQAGDAVVKAFEAIGWTWGGTYRRSKDYHHFSLNGR
ncbi:MAG TPA: M15 family metallopeptidase [Actinomycetota bacterium]